MDDFQVPNPSEIEKAYDALILSRQGKRELSLAEWICYSRHSRFDARLGELWILAIQKAWTCIPGALLNEMNLQIPSPAVLAVLLEQVESLIKTKSELEKYRLWKSLVCYGISPAEGEQFFIGLRGFGTEKIREDSQKSLKPYQLWGYLGSEMLVNKFAAHQLEKPRTYLDAETRKNILKRLIEEKAKMTVQDYIEECGGAISRRCAQLDLQDQPRLKAVGNTRERVYLRVPHRS